jgi:hypothetical protein
VELILKEIMEENKAGGLVFAGINSRRNIKPLR